MSGNHLLKSCRHDDEMMMMMMMMAMTIWNLLVCSTAKRNKTPHFICMFGCGGGVKLIPWPNFSSTGSLGGGGEVIWTKSKRIAVFFGIKGRHQKLLNGFFQLRELFWAA